MSNPASLITPATDGNSGNSGNRGQILIKALPATLGCDR